MFRGVNIYADCKRLKPLYDYISGHTVNGNRREFYGFFWQTILLFMGNVVCQIY